ncbi:MAG: hypothetical protein HY000_29620 [Planctomycetes bacterium]|nr:hypothetical protein [Planctomycetota bacterium]
MDTASPFVSDVVSVRLQVHAPKGVEVELPRLESLPKELHVSSVSRSGPNTNADGSQAELSFKLDVLLAGKYELPAMAVQYREMGESVWTTAETEPVSLEFRSLLGDNPDEFQPKPNPGPTTMPRGPLPWLALTAILGMVGLLGAAAWFVRARWSHRPKPVPMISAYRKAMDAIHRIDLAGWLERGDVDRFYTELSGVIRHYIEDRFTLRAPEQTTEEFLQELATRPVLASDQRLALANFLEQCDLVKFARMQPTTTQDQTALRAAREFVEATRDDTVLVAC